MSVETKEGQYYYGDVYELGASHPLSSISQRAYSGLSLEGEGWILDIGGGSGRFPLQAPRPRSARFLVIDINKAVIDQCRAAILQDGRMDEAVVGDITKLASLPAVQNREFRGAVSWRVIHALTRDQQLQVLDQVRRILPERVPFFLAVASDTDWKAAELKAQGIYTQDGPNNCAGIMGLTEPFQVDFFNPDKLEKLVARAGFKVEGIEGFQEPTGYDKLRETHPLNDYLFCYSLTPTR
ncbi:hypothetical protein A3H81_02995 [Candidatus Daviesbacteria bacterium RIFCSPLOWO2_02_FULL_38_18]|uniref:Methyltransferase domain-containing protein n=1 Tax=Candidatus Daviesbacteria bacterium GW2011_GWF2_38_6 TaxID=1618432 RepID=A0A0G0KFV3_9BACT|nr:MAG: hypothetical protein US80_C0016G0016 [Candidatus Daviesbacteria bacterium GW2011_GWA2_38_17]KKQ77627.1 MAG: hypothetical protein US99_C0037G0007 [Candidatus Daviesbacteria bacterium GW2011_GWF2_38_6]OGE45389.1 MAG: hypothetical protein A3E67_01095 [Candidatus Daviesbacteria bacterium RIFCSPHIGHO2_12_FULL_38_25]OGE68133.1 MAG: hypothetical protein A3H81_02995 [Candidatus Daviesbacteria bacterium RIFCSPLOWO2_02_FULL_38_18]OGE72678.1 MAG: hypothetical protein A3H18_02790 [Candidatus Davies